jgi:DNA adenine methylase
MAKPIVKWAGGKSKLLGELLARVPTHVRTYAEPFAGGAALFFALVSDGSRSFDHAVLADQNEELVACYGAVKNDVHGLVDALRGYRYDRDTFYRVRDEIPSGRSDVERGARVIYLNRSCFNGLWRVNAAGKFNVPFGRYENPRILDEPGLLLAHEALSRADVVHADFEEVTRGLGAGDFAYFDPPYIPLSKTASFTAYARGGFGPKDQERLSRVLYELRERRVLAMLSNADTEDARELYRDFDIQVLRAPRAINSDAKKRGSVNELLVTSWGPSS